MEICQIVALVTEQEFRDAATTVRDRLLEIEPDMSKSPSAELGFLRRPLLVDTTLNFSVISFSS